MKRTLVIIGAEKQTNIFHPPYFLLSQLPHIKQLENIIAPHRAAAAAAARNNNPAADGARPPLFFFLFFFLF